jgi:UDP:flavonoid glycosyltransferase YjiC (YdhE family)
MAVYGFVSYGTYADFKISNIVISQLLQKNYIVKHLTSVKNNQLIENPNVSYMFYDTEKYINVSDPDVVSSTSLNPIDAGKFILYLHTVLKPVMSAFFKDCDEIIAYSPALILMNAYELSIPTSIIWVSPSYPTNDLPWLFSKETQNYKSGVKYTSSIELYKKMSLLSLNSFKNFSSFINPFKHNNYHILDLIRSSKNYICWPKMVAKYPSFLYGDKVYYTNNYILNIPQRVHFKAENALKKIITDKTVYVSFGTYKPLSYRNLRFMLKFLTSHNYTIICHSIQEKNIGFSHPSILYYHKFIPHEWVIKKVKLVITSGSLGMVSVANFYGVPLIYVPILYEQFYWAKAYKQATKQSYIENKTSIKTVKKIIEDVIFNKNPKLLEHTIALKKHLQKYRTKQIF